MARIGILTLYATGHLNPSLALARALQQRGHQPIVFNLPDTAAAVARAEVSFLSYGEAEYPAGSLATTMQQTAELTGPAAFMHYVQRMILFFRAGFRELPALLQQHHLDLLVIDQVYYAGATVAEHTGLPFITLANALLVNREDVIPPPIMLWPYDDSPAGVERNRKGWADVDQAYSHLLPVVNEQRIAWGLAPYSNLLEDSFSPLLQLAQQPALFDFPRPGAPSSLRFIGHLHDTAPAADIPFDWTWLDRRPLIYASCGTLQNRLEHVFRAIIEACGPLDAQTVIALGPNGLPPTLFSEAPPNICLVPYAPQARLLQRAAACITHAGLNTTLDCLEAGVPMVAVPLASEQPGIAMRIAHLGAGRVLPLTELSGERLRAELLQVLQNPSYRQSAHAASERMAALDPAGEAVTLIEQVLQPS